MLRIGYELLRDFGTPGIIIVLLGIVIWLIWKIKTNCLVHIANDIKEQGQDIKGIKEDLSVNSNRISKIEGRIEID